MTEKALLAQDWRLSLIPSSTLILKPDKVIVTAIRAFRQNQTDPEDIVGRPVTDLLHPMNPPADLCPSGSWLAKDIPYSDRLPSATAKDLGGQSLLIQDDASNIIYIMKARRNQVKTERRSKNQNSRKRSSRVGQRHRRSDLTEPSAHEQGPKSLRIFPQPNEREEKRDRSVPSR
jgi:hypothetical protein